MGYSRTATTPTVEGDGGIFWYSGEVPSFDISELHMHCSLDVTCRPLFVLADIDVEECLF